MTLKLDNKSNLTEIRGITSLRLWTFFLGKIDLLRLGSNILISRNVNSQRRIFLCSVWDCVGFFQWDSPLMELPSPRGDDERDRPLSVFSELFPFWLRWSEEPPPALDEDEAEVEEGLAFSLKSVMMTVRSPTVTSRCCALLRSMFFNLGLIFL